MLDDGGIEKATAADKGWLQVTVLDGWVSALVLGDGLGCPMSALVLDDGAVRMGGCAVRMGVCPRPR